MSFLTLDLARIAQQQLQLKADVRQELTQALAKLLRKLGITSPQLLPLNYLDNFPKPEFFARALYDLQLESLDSTTLTYVAYDGYGAYVDTKEVPVAELSLDYLLAILAYIEEYHPYLNVEESSANVFPQKKWPYENNYLKNQLESISAKL
jgi:hypothetical protein